MNKPIEIRAAINEARNINKNPEASFSGIPAIVLGRREGITTRKNEDIKPIIFAFFSPKEFRKIFLDKKKKAITVRANMNTGKIIAE